MKSKILKFFRTWKEELIGIPIALFLFFFSADLLVSIDPSAGKFDAGVLQVIFFIHVKGMFFMMFSWLAIYFTFPSVWKFYQTEFEKLFIALEPWQKLKLSVTLLFSYFFALVMLGLSL